MGRNDCALKLLSGGLGPFPRERPTARHATILHVLSSELAGRDVGTSAGHAVDWSESTVAFLFPNKTVVPEGELFFL